VLAALFEELDQNYARWQSIILYKEIGARRVVSNNQILKMMLFLRKRLHHSSL
jgi:hypothetical protein